MSTVTLPTMTDMSQRSAPPPIPIEDSVIAGRSLHEQRVAEMRAKAREILRLKNLGKEEGSGSTVISASSNKQEE